MVIFKKLIQGRAVKESAVSFPVTGIVELQAFSLHISFGELCIVGIGSPSNMGIEVGVGNPVFQDHNIGIWNDRIFVLIVEKISGIGNGEGCKSSGEEFKDRHDEIKQKA